MQLCFGVHNHQPIGNFDHVVVEATEQAYRPFLDLLLRRPEIRVTMHVTGSLLEWLRERAGETFDLLGTAVARGQVELLTGGFYEPILAVLPDHDKLGQIAQLSEFVKEHFGVRPRGMWLAERVWEPHLPRALRDAGVEFVLVDDSHFSLAGLDPESIGGYYLTEEQGAVVAVFPINQRLRYLIPFADVQKSFAYLETRRAGVDVLTMMDDGEKFGAWPGTHALVYERGWLDRFFDRVVETPWLRLSTFSEVLDREPATDRVYLPAASYREMGEWALAPAQGRDLRRAKEEVKDLPDAERLVTLLRGGFWRSFLVKYPEVADVYWKMLRLSDRLQHELAARPDEARLHEARLALRRGQANDAYWHGVFGGCYLPHLRRAVKQSLLDCEERLAGLTGGAALRWSRGDLNGDGRQEISVRTAELSLTINPDRGGTITELAWLPQGLDLADVLTRRPELYHDRLRHATGGDGPPISVNDEPPVEKEEGLAKLLEYDQFRRASLLDAWLDEDGEVDAVAPWPGARLTLGGMRFGATIATMDEEQTLSIVMTPEGEVPIQIEKGLAIRGATVSVRYRLRASPGRRLDGRWAVQWNLTLTAGAAADRYFDLPGRPMLGSTGRMGDLRHITLVDEWAGVRATLGWSAPAELAWGPVETVSVSEAGFERIYQGTAILITWRLPPADAAELTTDFTVSGR